jgi:hypothetical protein
VHHSGARGSDIRSYVSPVGSAHCLAPFADTFGELARRSAPEGTDMSRRKHTGTRDGGSAEPSAPLGGNTLWLTGNDSLFYYAHMSGYGTTGAVSAAP